MPWYITFPRAGPVEDELSTNRGLKSLREERARSSTAKAQSGPSVRPLCVQGSAEVRGVYSALRWDFEWGREWDHRGLCRRARVVKNDRYFWGRGTHIAEGRYHNARYSKAICIISKLGLCFGKVLDGAPILANVWVHQLAPFTETFPNTSSKLHSNPLTLTLTHMQAFTSPPTHHSHSHSHTYMPTHSHTVLTWPHSCMHIRRLAHLCARTPACLHTRFQPSLPCLLPFTLALLPSRSFLPFCSLLPFFPPSA